MKNWIKSHIPTQRRLIQLYAALLYNAHLKGYITGNIYTGAVKNLCVPGFNCYSCPGAIGACPLGALQNAIAASGNRTPSYVLGILMLYGLTFGRTICGFLCPLGLLQDLVHKIPTVKIRKNHVTHVLSYLKYVILAIFVVIVPLWYSLQSYPVPAFCKYICPEGTFGGALGLLSNPVNFDKYSMLGILFTRKFLILLVITALCVLIYRAFCRFLCPLGAIYGLFAKVCVIGVKVEAPKCTDCGRCVRECPMDIRRVGDHECIHCGKCLDVCPTKAISYKAGKITLHGPEIETQPEKKKAVRKVRVIAWIAALVLLAGALWFFNKPDAKPVPAEPVVTETVAEETVPAVTEDTSIPVGYEVGMRAPDFTAEVYGETPSTFHLADHRGKTVIVNFWATWCTPCCNELPHFDELYRKHSEDVVVIALHSNMVTDDVEKYLGQFDYQMPFGLDTTGEIIASFNGSTMLPQTVVIDANGIITYNKTGSVTYEMLEKLVADAAVTESVAKDPVPAAAEDTSIPVGYEAGNRAPDFTAEVYGENASAFHLADHRGKTVIVNFWATWCTPCCNELPHFDELYRKHSEDVVVIALHSNMVTDDVEKYLGQFDYQMPFGLDTTGEIITSFHGSTMLPQTVVIDANGIITYNKTGSVTYEMLEKLVAEAAVNG